VALRVPLAAQEDRSMSAIMFSTVDGVKRAAELSTNGLYRYSLTRAWDMDRPRPWVTFVMLNPSTADALVDDPTIRRCMRFARDWGFGGLEVVNLYAYRATDPSTIHEAADAGIHPVGPDNHRALDEALKRQTVVAWGAHPMAASRVDDLLARCDDPLWLWCLGMTKSGAPRHPLYVRADQPAIPWARP
jgi:hypothetical protein